MPPADAGDFLLDEDDDDFFRDFNPHPYRGGYDLAATFGTPLPPSSDICYPLSSAAIAVPATHLPPSPTPEPEDAPPEEPHGDEKAPRDLVYETAEVIPKGAAREGKVRRGRWFGRGFRKKCVRVLDYLFCYKDPYAEQPNAVDRYVVPVYAKKKGSGEDVVEVKVAPASVGIVEADEELVQTNDLTWHSNNRNEADTYSQSMSNSHYAASFAQSYGLPGVLGKPDWFLNFSYSESHQEEFQHEAVLPYDIEHKISDQPFHCYHHHCYKQPPDVQVEPLEPVSSERLEYCEDFSTYYDQSGIHILETPAQAYNIQSYPSIPNMPLEPFINPSCSQNWGFYDAYAQGSTLENDTHSLISGEYGGIGSLFISPFYPGETESFELPPADEHASFQHNWHSLRYRNMPMDGVSLITQPAEDSYSMMNGSSWPFEEHAGHNLYWASYPDLAKEIFLRGPSIRNGSANMLAKPFQPECEKHLLDESQRMVLQRTTKKHPTTRINLTAVVVFSVHHICIQDKWSQDRADDIYPKLSAPTRKNPTGGHM